MDSFSLYIPSPKIQGYICVVFAFVTLVQAFKVGDRIDVKLIEVCYFTCRMLLLWNILNDAK